MKVMNINVNGVLPPIGEYFDYSSLCLMFIDVVLSNLCKGAKLPQTTLFAQSEDLGLLYEKNSPGYFDVLYLDEDCLIIQQANGGYFVSIRDPAPIDSFL